MTTDRSPYGVGGYGTGTYGYSPYVHAEAASNVLLASIADAQRAVYRYFAANSVIVTSAIANAITSYTALAAASGFAGISSTALAQAVFGASASSDTHLFAVSSNYAGPYWGDKNPTLPAWQTVNVELGPWLTRSPRTSVL